MLQSNEVPDQPWKSIAIDFITDLLISDGYDTNLVVIDGLTKMHQQKKSVYILCILCF